MEERGTHHRTWGRLRIFVGVVLMAFAVTLAVVVGNRLSDEALAVLAGAVCGVGAAIPTSLLIVTVTRRRDELRDFGELSRATRPTPSQGPYPPVVVVTPSAGQQRPDGWNTLPSSWSAPIQRHFTVVGGPAEDADDTPRVNSDLTHW
jgi:hypothetical protein